MTPLAHIQTTIANACKISKREITSVNLVAVSKMQDATKIEPLLQAGHKIFGENKVQEAAQKWPNLKAQYSDVELHLIGPLQSNKAAEAVGLFDVIETVDRESLALELAKQIKKQNKSPVLFVQVNTGAEPQKAGILPENCVNFIEKLQSDYGLKIDGLMCIPPVNELAAPHFALLAKLASEIGLSQLSMGMSADYEQAIMLGATHIRVGSALFGPRH